jgi:plastocyanin
VRLGLHFHFELRRGDEAGCSDNGFRRHGSGGSLAFTPAIVHAKVGRRIMWVNEDSSPHDVRYVSGPRFTSSRVLSPGAKFSIKLTQSGTIHYFCSLHPWMKATVVVSP